MATMLQSESRRLYSWWWDSHISPKNSKWLQDNLTDMDSKVKAMIKLIEEDADSFARRAEMYYKKRPELMKMVEEFYRAYRALAERYDHATGALRQAHNTMAKAFPNQIPLVLTDDSPSGSSGPEVELRTPDMPSPIHTLFDFDDFDKDACLPSHSHVIKRSGTYSEENNILSRKGLKQLNEIYPTGEGEEAYANLSEGRVKKGLHFLAEEGKGYEYKNSRGLKEDTQNEIKRLREELTLLLAENQNLKSHKTSESERADKAESDVRNLKDSLSKLSFENEDITLEYKQAVERIASMETKMSQIQDEFKKLNDVIVMEAMKLDSAENRCVLLDKENQSLRLELEAKEQKTKDLQEENSQLSTENWNLKTQVASDSQRADKAESEVQSVKDNLSKSEFEMEAAIFQYRQSVERISYLEADLSRTENDFMKLSDEMVMQAAKLNSAEDRCLVLLEENRSLRLQLDSLEQKIKAQRQEHDQLSAENENLKSLITTESDRAQNAEIEFQLVKSHISELNFDKEAAVNQYQQSLEMISYLQTQASRAQEEYIKLCDEMAMEAMKLSSAEEQSLVLDNANQSLKTELGILEQKIRDGQEEISQLSAVVENLKSQLTLESERVYKAETEVQNLRESLSKSNFENESCIQQYQQSLEKISYLETQISQAQDDYRKLTDEMIAETMKSRLVDERCVLLEKANESIKLEVGTLEKEKKAAEEEVIYHQLELEKINTSLQDEHERLVKTQMALLLVENLHSESQEEVKRLGLEIQCAVHKLNDAELKNISLEEESCNIKEENSALNEQNLSSALQIKVLQDETNILKEMNGKFENEMRLYLEEKKLLQHNFDRLKEDKNELEQKHLNLTEQMEVVSLNAESLHASLKKLQDENVELHEICKTHEEEKSLLLENLKTMEDISVKNRVMENSLADVNVEHQELRMKIKALEQSCEALNEEVSTYITEKATLISQIETITQNMEKLMEENTFLENSSSVLNLEVEGLRGKLNDVEDSLRSLDDQKESLTTERNILVSQVDTITQNKEKLMEENDFLENSLSLVNLEVEGLREKLKNLEDSLQSLYAEKEILITERNTLVSQVETATQNTDKLMEENTFLENSYSLVNLEIEGLRVKLKYSEDSLQSLYTEKDNLTAERNTIVSQIETMTQNTEKLMEEKTFLENSLSLVNLEVEGLRGKLKDLENSLQSLYTEKENLTSERNTLVSQVETLTLNLENLTEENALLVNSLSFVNLEVEGLKGKLKDYENSLQSLYTEKENLTSERNTLVFQVETLTQNSENLTEENAFLVNSLSLVNLEVEGLREKLKDLEDSLQSLYTEKENLTSERNTLVSQVETSTQNMENLTEENGFLVNSLSLVNLEVEGLREKLKDLEDSLPSLYTQKENLTAERNILVSQVDSISQTMESVEKRHAELEIKHLNLEKENKSRINEVLELESVLNLEKKGHATFVQSSKNQLSILEDQILVLREENQVREEEVEAEQRKVMSHQIELLVLHSFLRDMNEVILRLSWDCQKHLEASRCAEKLASKLQEEGTIQMDQMSLFLAHNEKVKEGIFMLLRALNINDCVSEDREKDGVLLEIVLDEIRNLLNSVSGAEDEVKLLQLEMSVIITLLGQTGLHVEDLRIEKQFLEKELEIRKDEVSVLQCNKQELLEINEQLRQDIEHSNHREEEMKYAMGALQWQLSDSQDAQRASQTEIHKVLDEYQSLLRTSDSLREKKEALEEENSVVIAEAMTLEHLYLLFKSFGTERAFELKLFSDDAYCLSAVNNNLDREIRQMNEKFRVLETENIHLKESVACLEEYRRCLLGLQFDLHTSKYYCDELIDQVETGSNLLVQKERELSETNKKVQSTQKKIVELSRNLECLNEEIYKAKIAREELQNKNFSLSEGIACKDKEIERIGEVNESLYDELKILNSEVGTLRSREEQLTSRLQNGIDEIDRCEVEIMTLLSDTQFSTVSATIFEEKVFELMLESESLEISAMIQREVLNEEIHSRNAYARELKEKLDDLEGENRGLKAHLDAYLPLVMSLQDGIASLQEQTLSLARRPGSINQESQENIVASHQQHDEDLLGEDPTATVPSGLLELQKLTAKFGILQKVITDTASLLEKERVDYNTDLEAARKEIRDMQEKRSSSQEENKASKAVVTQLENDSEHSKLKHVQMMKDIQLDQVSSSPYENSVGSYGPTRIENSETDDQMLKLWEAAERACMGQMKRPPQLVLAHDIEPVEEEKSEYPSSELVAEKELSVDRLEVSSDQEWSRKVIERLASDTQRLLVLRTSIQELERKMENYEKDKQPKSLEYDTIRTKLNEAEGTVLELIDINSKLAKKAEEFLTGSSGAQEETERRRRMRISGRAQRGSEKVDRLELELQKIQYIMLKLEEEHSNDIAKAADRRPKIILGDYIHGKRNVEKPKKRSFCGCIRPKTKDN